jgi:hypothetical protein
MEWRKTLYYLPGIGLATHAIREYKTRKGKRPVYDIVNEKDRKALGIYVLETGLLALGIAWKVYLGNGIATGEWNPFKYNSKEKIEKNVENKKNLEKAVKYEDILKVIG